MRRIALAAAKGGTGRTTTAINLGHALALAGHEVIVVDCDPRRHAARHLGLPPDPGLVALLTGQEAQLTEVRQGLHLLDSGGCDLERLEPGLGDPQAAGLAAALRALPEADFVLLDAPPGPGSLHDQVLAACDEVLLPVTSDWFGLEAAAVALERLDTLARHTGLRPRFLGLLPTFHLPDAPSTPNIEQRLATAFDGKVLASRIRWSEGLRVAPSRSSSIFEEGPLCKAAHDYAELAEELLRRAA